MAVQPCMERIPIKQTKETCYDIVSDYMKASGLSGFFQQVSVNIILNSLLGYKYSQSSSAFQCKNINLALSWGE